MPSISNLAPGGPRAALGSLEDRTKRLIAEGRIALTGQEWANAERHFLMALELRRQSAATDDLRIQECYLRLAEVELGRGDYRNAFVFLEQVRKQILRLGSSHEPLRADLAFELALKYEELEFPKEAIQLYTETVADRIRNLGPEHIDTRIARFWLDLQRDDQASNSIMLSDDSLSELLADLELSLKSYFRRKKSLSDEFIRDDNRIRWTFLQIHHMLAFRNIRRNNRAAVLRQIKRLQFIELNVSNLETDIAELIGDIHYGLGDPLTAQRHYSRSLSLLYDYQSSWKLHAEETRQRKIQLAMNARQRAELYRKMAQIYKEGGDLKSAESYLRYELAAEIFGNLDEHCDAVVKLRLINPLSRLASLYWRSGKIHEAVRLWYDLLDLYQYELQSVSVVHNENLTLQSLNTLREMSFELLELLVQESRPEQRTMLVKLGFTAVLSSQGRLADEMANRFGSQSITSMDRRLKAQRQNLYLRRAALEYAAPALYAPQEYEEQRMYLDGRIEAVERELALGIPFRQKIQEPVGSEKMIADLARRLPPDTLLINYASYWPRAAYLPSGSRISRCYIAFLLRSGGQMEAVSLGSAKFIDESTMQMHEALLSENSEYFYPAKLLFNQIILPILAQVRTVKNLMIVPDGKLNLIPFAALSEKPGSFLGDYASIVYLSSGRDLAKAPTQKPANDVLVLANPDINAFAALGGGLGLRAANFIPMRMPNSRLLRRTPHGLNLDAMGFLPYTQVEAQAIQQLYPAAQLKLGVSASEPLLFGLANPPGILHLAMHGAYLDDWDDESLDAVDQRRFSLVLSRDPPHPLLRSMLVLAGAARGRSSPNDVFDGLATAMEISTMQLRGTQLVVLSACDTGRGVIQAGEGVAGLRRAFLVAGAETVVASFHPESPPPLEPPTVSIGCSRA